VVSFPFNIFIIAEILKFVKLRLCEVSRGFPSGGQKVLVFPSPLDNIIIAEFLVKVKCFSDDLTIS
jgi:hypothetical protein